MIFFGHVGITLGFVQAFNSKVQTAEDKVDLRIAALLSVAPDLIDKPIGIYFRETLGSNTRLIAHSLLASLCFLTVLLIRARSKEKKLKSYLVFWSCYLGHMLLDRIWEKNLPSFLWPFYGPLPKMEMTILERWGHAFVQPYSIFGEVTGISILMFLFFSYRLYCDKRWLKFLKSGDLLSLE